MKSILVLNCYVIIVILGAWGLMHRKQKLWFFETEEVFTYNGNRLEAVNDFNYLGTVFNYTGNFSLNQQQLVGKGLKALTVLLLKCRKYRLKVILHSYFILKKMNERITDS